MSEWTLDKAAASLSASDVPATPTPEVTLSSKAESTKRLEANPHPIAKVATARTAHKAAGKIVSGLTEIVSVEWAQRPDKNSEYGYDVEEPDEDDVQLLEDSTEEGFADAFPDADLPWWLGMTLAAGNVVIGVRKGRSPRLTPKITGKKPKPDEKKESPVKLVPDPPQQTEESKDERNDGTKPESNKDRPVGI